MHPTAHSDTRCVNALRFLSADAVEQANSGHPGLPLGAAPMVHALWSRHLRFDPRQPTWADRDRFVLSAGHGSALLYSALHLFGFDLSLDDLASFRQWGTRTPGHPERGLTPGVEVTTGPLGQGAANAVGLAIAERHLAAVFNRPGHEIVNHRTFALVGDGDLMEGIAYEAFALAGHLRLGNLIVLYDSNDICLAGSTSLSTSEDIAQRFGASGWHVQTVADGRNLDAIDRALAAAVRETERPSLVVVKTIIGYGSPTKQNTYGAHGAPLGAAELAAAKLALDWPVDPPFFVPDDVRAHCATATERATTARRAWDERFARYRQAFPDLATEFERRISGQLPSGWEGSLPAFAPDRTGVATRKASETVLQALAMAVPELFGGSADLNPSTLTWMKGAGDFQPPSATAEGVQGRVGGPWGYAGRNVHFGVREHSMGAIANGLAAHGGVVPYASTFLVFSDYLRPAIRVAALSHCRTIFVFTHDSIGVGEDGPTHQPVEQMMSLRLIPNLVVLRPADASETAIAWRVALERQNGPTALILSRQALPTFDRAATASADGVAFGGYTLWESSPEPELLLVATGSEVHVALDAGRQLASGGIRVRVVSLPSLELFTAQAPEYRDRVLPPQVRRRVVIEAGRTLGWGGLCADGVVLGVDEFGTSAPGPEVLCRYGFTVERIVSACRALLSPQASP